MARLKNKYSTLLFIRSLLKAGSEKQSLLLQKHIENDCKSLLIVFHDHVSKEYSDVIAKENIDVKILQGNLLNKLFEIYSIYRSNKIDVTISYLFIDNVVSAVFGIVFHVPKIIGGYRSASLTGKFKFGVQRFLNNNIFTRMVVNSYAGKDFLVSNGFDQDKLVVIQNGIELNDEPIIRESKGTVVILTVGRFDYFKAYRTSLQVVKDVIEKCSGIDIQYRIVGYGPLEKDLYNWIRSTGFEDGQVRVFIDPVDIQTHYLNADIYLSTSLSEGMSNSIMEAINYSLPVVATNVGDNSYLVKENENGFLCDVEDRETLANKLQVLVDSDESRTRMGEMGFNILARSFGIGPFAEKFKTIIFD